MRSAKTQLCYYHKKGRCTYGEGCRFAHSLAELQPVMTNSPGGESVMIVPNNLYKTQLCQFYFKGHCKNGNLCHYAHDQKELMPPSSDRTAIPVLADELPPITATGPSWSDVVKQNYRPSMLPTEAVEPLVEYSPQERALIQPWRPTMDLDHDQGHHHMFYFFNSSLGNSWDGIHQLAATFNQPHSIGSL